jgi:hypothetical protein
MNNYIEPEAFMKQMDRHWTKELGNVGNEPLKQSWHRLAELFRDQIIGDGDEERRTHWKVYFPPTGSGKTEGTMLYSSMLGHFDDLQHPGVLIIVRLIDDCIKIASRINEHVVKYGYRESGVGYAIDYHTENKSVAETELKDYPVLVITHEAYRRALDSLGGNPSIRNTWKFFHSYRDTNRKLLVIDEALDIVEHVHLSYGEVSRTLSSIDLPIQRAHREAIQYIKCVIEYLEETVGQMGEDGGNGKEGLPRERVVVLKNPPKEVPNFQALIDDMKSIRFDWQDKREDLKWSQKRFMHHQKIIKGIQNIATLWAFYSRDGVEFTINSARLLVPPGVSGPVVLDATGKTNKVYELHKQVVRVEPPEGCRTYKSLNIHTAVAPFGIGKGSMIKNGEKMCTSLIDDLNRRLKPADKVLVVSHKKIEHLLKGLETNFELHTTHWGALDGSNEWRDCNVVVIFGIQFMPTYWSANTYFSLKEESPTKKSFNREFWFIRRELENTKILTDVIQAINRIRSRKVIDQEGNCPQTDCYLLLSTKRNDLSDYLQEGLRTAMPDVRIKDDWDFSLTKRKGKITKSKVVFLKFIENMEPDTQISVSMLRSQLNLRERTLMGILSDIQTDYEMKQILESRGIVYITRREGSTKRGYLVKAA